MLYTLEDFQRILTTGIEYVLPQTVVDKISVVTNEIGKLNTETSNHVSRNSYSNHVIHSEHKPKRTNLSGNNREHLHRRPVSTGGKHANTNRHVVNDEEWNRIAAFKLTPPIEKSEKDVIMDKIRVCLNKISDKTYQLQVVNIIGVIDGVMNNTSNDIDMVKQIATAIFDIASNNKFYSNIYADLYIDISNKYSIFKENIVVFLAIYRESMRKIENVSPEKDYNKFCENNKKNDIRKAISTFIANIVLKGFLEMSYVIETILELQGIVVEYMEFAEKTQELEEITENIYILVSILNMHCKTHEKWAEIIENIRGLSKLKAKIKPGLSSRAIFKYMDILDKVK
jgi:hypothetical protein